MKVFYPPVKLLLLLSTGFTLNTQAQEFASNLSSPNYPTVYVPKPQQGKSLKSALLELEQKFKVSIMADNALLDGKQVPKVEKFVTVEEALTKFLKGSRLKFDKVSNQLYIIMPLDDNKTGVAPIVAPINNNPILRSSAISNLGTVSIQAVDLKPKSILAVALSGRVTDNTGNGLPGVTVLLKGTTTGTTTNAEGNYSLSVPDGNGTLVFSYVGYVAEEVSINNQTVINVSLVPDIKSLNEVVVVGYGTQKKSDLTGAVAQVKEEDLKRLPVTNVQTALQGQAAGVYVSQSNGAPGAGADVVIRGQTSVTGLNQVLYVVDGIPITGGLNSINPQDIKSIEVLKDASAAAIYGSRASSGVVLITTKRGRANETKISFDAFYGWQQLTRKIDLTNAQEWAELQEEAVSNTLARNPNASISHNPNVWDAANGRVREGIADSTDWQDAYYRVAPTQNYYLSFAGGNDKSQIFVGAGYQRQDGIAPNTYFQRYSVRLNSDHKLFSGRLRVGNNLALSFQNQRGVQQDQDYLGGVGTVLRMSPLIAVYKQPGTFERSSNRFAGTTNLQYYGDIRNPMREALLGTGRNNMYNLVGSLFADLEIIKGLTLHTEWGGELRIDDDKNFNQKWREYITFNDVNSLSRSYGNAYQLQARNFLTYKRSFGGHDFTVLAGTDVQDYHEESFNTQRTGFVNQEDKNLRYLGLGSDSTAINNERASEWAILSFYGRLNYTFNNKYLFTATLRRDGSSRFAPASRWGNFPSFSAGWNVSEEGFMKGISWVSNLKLRAGWGLLGNERSAGNYVTSSTIVRGIAEGRDIGYTFGANQVYAPGARPERIPNPELTWEISDQTNVGIDMGFFRNRLTVTADYFIKKTRDMILSQPLPIAGRGTLDAPEINIGTLQNTGLELEVSYAKSQGKFTFDVGLNFTTTRGNKITYLAEGVNYLDGGGYRGNQGGILSRSEVGKSIGLFYLYIAEGIFQSEEEITNHARQPGAGIGDYKFRDVNGDGIINEQDRTFYGNPWPLFIGGLKGNFRYKNFDLNVLFQGSYGNDILNTANWWMRNTPTGEPYNFHRDYLDRFHPVNNPDGKYAAPNIA